MPTDGTTPIPVSTAEDRMLDTLDSLIKNAASPDMIEAQTILLRRLALQGDVVQSRVPAPKNITEIGGYLNLLETLREAEMRQQMLAGIVGVAGPNPPLGWLARRPPLALLAITNDRPEGPAQPYIPLSFAVRSDFAVPLAAAVKALGDRGCSLPLMNVMRPLPQAIPGQEVPQDVLSWLGRSLDIVSLSALRDPTTDAIALARPHGSTAPLEIVARVAQSATIDVPAADYDAVKCDSASCTTINVNGKYVPIAPYLSSAGFYPKSPIPTPANQSATAWAHLTNLTGLIPGVSKLGDELALLYSMCDVSGSIFASCLNRVWDGANFVQP